MSPAELASELARVAHKIETVGDLERSRLLQLAALTIRDLRQTLPTEQALRSEALDELAVRLKDASQRQANNESPEVAMLLLDAAVALREVLGIKHEVVVESGPRTSD